MPHPAKTTDLMSNNPDLLQPDEREEDFHQWYVNDQGQCVSIPTAFWLEALNSGKGKEERFEPVKFYVENESGSEDLMLIHRPKGGLGDMICILPAVESLVNDNPKKEITVVIPETYHYLFDHLNITLANYKDFHKDGFNSSREPFKYQFFLWCPAGYHEWKTKYKVNEGRIRNFAEAIKVEPSAPKLSRKPLNMLKVKTKVKWKWQLIKSNVVVLLKSWLRITPTHFSRVQI